MDLLDSWSATFRNYSQQVFSVIALLPFGFLALPEKWQNLLMQHEWLILVFSLLALSGFVLRNIKQRHSDVANADDKVFRNDG